MPDFLLELRSEEIPARMQARAAQDLARLFAEQLGLAGLTADIETHATPRRLALIARGLPEATQAATEERRGPRADAPPQALEGFLKSTGLTRDQLEERAEKKGAFLYAVLTKPGRPTAEVLSEAIPAIVRAFPWPKSMRWGAASASTDSPRWVRPLQGVVALLGEQVVPFEIAGVTSGAATLGHRFHHPGIITIGSADDYEAKLRACHVILRAEERADIIRQGAQAAASAAGLTLVEDEALVAENAGLAEWPVPLLGRFDSAFLDVPPEVIVLTMRTNQKYFACTDAAGALAPAFVCTANIAATDGGVGIVRGNERVLSARLADAKFFWEADLKIPLENQAAKLGQIVFHEKLGTVADKVDRVAKLARWLIEEGIVGREAAANPVAPTPVIPAKAGIQEHETTSTGSDPRTPATLDPRLRGDDGKGALADLAERAARLCKADLVTQMVGEFPELQGTIGAHLARAQGEDPQIADAIRDHYKPVGQGDEVPTAPVTVAVSLADKLDTLVQFFSLGEKPSGSRDPFALRRAALGVIAIVVRNDLRFLLAEVLELHAAQSAYSLMEDDAFLAEALGVPLDQWGKLPFPRDLVEEEYVVKLAGGDERRVAISESQKNRNEQANRLINTVAYAPDNYLDFFADRLKVQQREAGVRHDLIDAVFALGGEDDLVRLLARVRALQAFVETPEGHDLLAGYKRAANILKKEGWDQQEAVRPERSRGAPEPHERPSFPLGTNENHDRGKPLSYTPEPVESSLIAALDSAEPLARSAIAAEDFAGAMAALASLRGPVDAFFDNVTVNDPDPAKRAARLALLARLRDAVHAMADFSKIEG